MKTHLPIDQIIHGDSIKEMKKITSNSIDLIVSDLPYGTTNCIWDKCLPLDELFVEYKRIIKPNAAILLFAQQPFATDLINQARRMFRYQIVWEKTKSVGFLNANKMPLRAHELILVFYNRLPIYNPQFTKGKPYVKNYNEKRRAALYRFRGKQYAGKNNGTRYPRDVIKFAQPTKQEGLYHPTQKPLMLLEYLIKTYSNEGDIVLDNTCGSGSTCVAAKKLNRRYIGIENDLEYVKIACTRCQALELLNENAKNETN